MRITRLVAIGLVVGLGACSSGGGSKAASPPTTTTPSTVPVGHDQAATPFCLTLTQLNDMKEPNATPAVTRSLVDDAAKQAPPTLQADMALLARFVSATLPATTTAPLTADQTSKLLAALNAVGAYASAHCGITLHLGQ